MARAYRQAARPRPPVRFHSNFAFPDGNTYNAYDNAHRPTKLTDRLSITQNITYNSAGNITKTEWKSAGGTTTFKQTATFDALGRMLTSVNGVTQTTAFTYDNNGSILTSPIA